MPVSLFRLDRRIHGGFPYGQSQGDNRAAAPPQNWDSQNLLARHALAPFLYPNSQPVNKTPAKNHPLPPMDLNCGGAKIRSKEAPPLSAFLFIYCIGTSFNSWLEFRLFSDNHRDQQNQTFEGLRAL
jgi:hypothetical protein